MWYLQISDSAYNFAKMAQLEVAGAAQLLKDMTDSCARMFEFYGDERKKADDGKNIEEFFKMIVTLAQQFEVYSTVSYTSSLLIYNLEC